MKIPSSILNLPLRLDLPRVGLDILPGRIHGCVFRNGSSQGPEQWSEEIAGSMPEAITQAIQKHDLQGFPVDVCISGPTVMARIVKIPPEFDEVDGWVETQLHKWLPSGMDQEAVMWSVTPLQMANYSLVSLYHKKQVQEIVTTLESLHCPVRSLHAGTANTISLLPDSMVRSACAVVHVDQTSSRILIMGPDDDPMYREIPVGVKHIRQDVEYYHTEMEKLTDIFLQVHKQRSRIKSFLVLGANTDIYTAFLEKKGYDLVPPAQAVLPCTPCAAAAMGESNIPIDLPGPSHEALARMQSSRRFFVAFFRKAVVAVLGAIGLLTLSEIGFALHRLVNAEKFAEARAAHSAHTQANTQLMQMRSRYAPFFASLSNKPDIPGQMQRVSEAVPKHLWLGVYAAAPNEESGSQCQVVGYTPDARSISSFIQNLENDPAFSGVAQRFTEIMDKRKVTKLSKVRSNKQELTRFKLEFQSK